MWYVMTKAQYTLATTLNSTRSTLLKVDKLTCCFGLIHTGNKVERTFDIRATESTVSATEVDRIGDNVDWVGNNVDRDMLSNSSCCRFVAKTGDKVDRISATVDFVADLSPVSATVDFVASVDNASQLPRRRVTRAAAHVVGTEVNGGVTLRLWHYHKTDELLHSQSTGKHWACARQI